MKHRVHALCTSAIVHARASSALGFKLCDRDDVLLLPVTRISMRNQEVCCAVAYGPAVARSRSVRQPGRGPRRACIAPMSPHTVYCSLTGSQYQSYHTCIMIEHHALIVHLVFAWHAMMPTLIYPSVCATVWCFRPCTLCKAPAAAAPTAGVRIMHVASPSFSHICCPPAKAAPSVVPFCHHDSSILYMHTLYKGSCTAFMIVNVAVHGEGSDAILIPVPIAHCVGRHEHA